MALTIKADTEDFTPILAMLGLGGLPREAAADTSDSGSSDSGDAEVIPVKNAPSKLQLLQHTLSGGSHDDAAAAIQPTAAGQNSAAGFVPVDSEPQPNLNVGSGEILPPDLSQPNIKPGSTFAARHPDLLKTFSILSTLGQGAAAGAGSRTFGEGFQRAQELPIDIASKKAALAKEQAQTEQLKTQVTLPNGLTVPFALAQKLYPTLLTEQGKNARNTESVQARKSIAQGHDAISLRKAGMKLDETTGQPVPIPYEELSPAEQATIDLKKSQKDAADARAQYDKFKSDPNSEQYKLARERLRIAAQNASTAAGRLGLEGKKYVADYLGLDDQGKPLPGVETDDQGRPIGPRVANAGKVPADRLKRGDLAANAIHNLNNVEEIINRRGDDLFGPVMGRITNIKDMVGSDDPDIAAIGTEIHNYALASNGAHGVRSQQAVEKTENEILNHFKRGQNGAMGGIRAAKDSLFDFVKDQQLRNKPRPLPAGQPGQASAPATHIYDPRTGTIAPVGR